jgi:hypothetical protein
MDSGYIHPPIRQSRYIVSGDPEHPICSCSELGTETPGDYCAHIKAVLGSLGGQSGTAAEDRYASEERLAIQNEHRTAADRARHGGPTVVLLKPGVRPDGRMPSWGRKRKSIAVRVPLEIAGRGQREQAGG